MVFRKYLIVLISYASINFSYAQKINFREFTNMEEMVKTAKQEKKDILIDAETLWCGPCKTLKISTFLDSTLINYLNSNYVCANVNMEDKSGWAYSIRKTIPIYGYPSFILITQDGNYYDQFVGFKYPLEFIRILEKTKKEKKEYSLFNILINKEIPQFLDDYFQNLKGEYKYPDSLVIYNYFENFKLNPKLNSANWNTIKNFSRYYHISDFILENIKKYEDSFPTIELSSFVEEIFNIKFLNKLYKTGDESYLKKYIDSCSLYFKVEKNETTNYYILSYLIEKKKTKAIFSFMKNYYNNNKENLNVTTILNYIDYLFENDMYSKDKEIFSKLKWLEKEAYFRKSVHYYLAMYYFNKKLYKEAQIKINLTLENMDKSHNFYDKSIKLKNQIKSLGNY